MPPTTICTLPTYNADATKSGLPKTLHQTLPQADKSASSEATSNGPPQHLNTHTKRNRPSELSLTRQEKKRKNGHWGMTFSTPTGGCLAAHHPTARERRGGGG